MTEQQFEQSICRIRQGDRDGLREIYEAYIAFIYTTVYALVLNKENAEDLTSEFFIKFWRIAGGYQAGSGHRGWMATIARNMTLDFLRKQKRELLMDEIPEEAAMQEHSVESEVIGELSIDEALAMLNEKEREIVNYKIIGSMTFQEIADLLQIPMGTVTWRYRNAITKLRRCGYEQGF